MLVILVVGFQVAIEASEGAPTFRPRTNGRVVGGCQGGSHQEQSRPPKQTPMGFVARVVRGAPPLQ